MKSKKKSKGDEGRNLYPNVMKATVNSLMKEKAKVFRNKLRKICFQLRKEDGEINEEEVLNYVASMEGKDYSLKQIYGCTNFHEGFEEERKLKKAFHRYLVWFLDRRYSIYVLNSEQC